MSMMEDDMMKDEYDRGKIEQRQHLTVIGVLQ